MISNSLSIWHRPPRSLGLPGVDGLIAWYDASKAGSIIIAGSGVDTWSDQSGNGYDLRQTVDSQRPAYSATAWGGASPGVTTDGIDDHLCAAFGAAVPASFAVIAAVSFDVTGGFGYGLGNQTDLNPICPIYHSSGAVRTLFRDDTGATKLASRIPDSDNVRSLTTFEVFDGISGDLRYTTSGGTLTDSDANNSAVSTLDKLCIGALARPTVSAFSALTISELIVCESVSDITALETYLSNKWALS